MSGMPPKVIGEYTSLDGEEYYQIANSHLMTDFFMSLVGAGDHWMFVSSNGALTAGRRNADLALFPYAADDQISTARTQTGAITMIRSAAGLWEPFAAHPAGTDRTRRNLYKTPLGNKLVFEEINESQQLAFRYRWAFSQKFGFVRSCRLENLGEKPCSLELLDGLRNVLPHGIGSEFLMRYSNLANAYKKSELVPDSQVGLYYLSSVPTDRAEPSEGLKSTTIWQSGLRPGAILLSTDQIAAFRDGEMLKNEVDVRGKAGAYLVNQSAELAPGETIEWQIVAELAQDHSDVIGLDDWLQRTADPAAEVAKDIHASEQEFLSILSSSDAIQYGSNKRRCNRHLSNTVFNVMRGGIPLEDYRVQSDDFRQYVANFNRGTLAKHDVFLTNLPEVVGIEELRARIAEFNDPDLTRLGSEYLPLAFSRRHGDPTRPWNHFSIELESETGRTNLNYQGNWRDIFQNWEALAVSFPEFSTAMISRFVNATTADGYNPYRLTRDGFEWEEPSPEDPWANIGYWGDHQIIYLLKLLEWSRDFHPQGLDDLLGAAAFTHANVPYRIKDYDEIRKDPQDTISFDADLSKEISKRVESLGADGKLLPNEQGDIHYVTLVEKLLTLSLAKLSNFIPDGGIWLNTQRPEWNDANNALVGSGVSMVTACYLHRWFKFLEEWFLNTATDSFQVSSEVAAFFEQIDNALEQPIASNGSERFQMVEALSKAGSNYRNGLYSAGLCGQTVGLTREGCIDFFKTARRHLDGTLRSNRRSDGLYHSYNLLDWRDDTLEIEPLYEMLEGQVAVLSSGLLTATESVEVLDALRGSALYRKNQNSYVLYPDRQLPRFLEKNEISRELAESNPLVQRLLAEDDKRLVHRDVCGGLHFNGDFRNSADLRNAVEALDGSHDGGAELIQVFDEIFGHRQFTGRSGTFFGYEGLGSIYWHMVSKLGLAVAENYFLAIETGASENDVRSLEAHYQAIRRGIGAEKSPSEYGAFPSDPYSHTPENAGVKQPGMTGQVKEDLLARFAELGVHIEGGCLGFRLELFDRSELLDQDGEFTFFDLQGQEATVPVPAKGFGFTLFQVPFIYQPGDEDRITVCFQTGDPLVIEGLQIDRETSGMLFARSGTIKRITCNFGTLRH